MEPKLGAQPFQEFDAAAAETFERTLEKNYTCVTWPKLCAVKEPSWEEEKVQIPWRFFVNKNGKKPTKQTGELVRIYMDSRKDSFIFSSKVHEDCVIYFLIFGGKIHSKLIMFTMVFPWIQGHRVGANSWANDFHPDS